MSKKGFKMRYPEISRLKNRIRILVFVLGRSLDSFRIMRY